MIALDGAAILVAFAVTVIELTEVVALVFALTASEGTVRHGALGAIAGVGVIAAIALGSGAAILALPARALLWASVIVLAGFGVFLSRSTLKTYRRARAGASATTASSNRALQFAGGFTVGAIEATEVVVVLLALTAAGQGRSAVLGAVAGGILLVAVALAVHERVRRVKTAWLKLGATSMVFAFAAFWGGEALGVAWPGGDLFLAPLFLLALICLRGTIRLILGPEPPSGGVPGPSTHA